MARIILLNYLILGLLVILFNILGLWYAAGAAFGAKKLFDKNRAN